MRRSSSSTARSCSSTSPPAACSASRCRPSPRDLWEFAQAELDDTRRIVEKIAALGGDPTTKVAKVTLDAAIPAKTIDALIESEDEAIAALHAVIPHSGQEPRSEALEHLMEHLIMRKQNQVDWLRRARREP